MTLVHEQTIASERSVRSGASLKTLRTKAGLVLADAGVAVLACTAASEFVPEGADRVTATLIFLVTGAMWLGRARLYSARFITRRSDEIRRIVDAVVLTTATVSASIFVFDFDVARSWLGLAAVFTILGLTIERELVRRHYDRLRSSGALQRNVLMIGNNEESRRLSEMFDQDRSLGYSVVDHIDPRSPENTQDLVTRTLAAARRHDASGVVVAATSIDAESSNRLIRDLIDAGIHVELSSTLADIAPGRLTVRPLGRFPVVYIEPVQRRGWRAVAKRSFDVATATMVLILLSPLLTLLALLVKRGSEGPVIFKQSRVGKDGVPFEVWKFRTMVYNAEELVADLLEANEGAGPLFKMKDDPRITGVGSFLRKTSLDELPQLWNVVRGEMSLVGPRPALKSEMVAWDADLYGRLRVRPGITGMWQVSGRSETTFEEYTRLDLYYVDNWSLVVDLAILAKTIPAVLKSDGAY